MDAIEQRLTTDVTGAQAVVDLGAIVRNVELDRGRPVNLVRIGMVVDALSRYLVDGGAMLYGVAERSLLSEPALTSKERMVLGRWTDDGVIEVTPAIGDRVLEIADLTGLPVITTQPDPGLAERFGWLADGSGRVLLLTHRAGVAALRPLDGQTAPPETGRAAGSEPVIGRARVPQPGRTGEQPAQDPEPGPAGRSGSTEAAETPVAPAEDAETPVAPAEDAETPVAPAEDAETPVAPAGDAETPVAPAGDAETPVAPAGDAETPEGTIGGAETPVAPAEVAETPVAPAGERDSAGGGGAEKEPVSRPATRDRDQPPAGEPGGERAGGLPLPVEVFADRGAARAARTRVSWRRFWRAGPSQPALLRRRFRCEEFECPAFGEHRRIGQPVPRMRGEVATCPRHDEPVVDIGRREPAYPVSIVVDDLPRRRLVVRNGQPVEVGRAAPDGTGADPSELVSVSQWMHQAAAAWVSPVHLRLEATEAGLVVTDLSENGSVVWQRKGPDDQGTARPLHGDAHSLGEWDSVELYTGIELVRGDRRLTGVLDRDALASVLVDAPTAAYRQVEAGR
jgi:hypothetical protein